MAANKNLFKALVERWIASAEAMFRKRGQRGLTLDDYNDYHDAVFENGIYDHVDLILNDDPEKKARLTQRLMDFLNSIPIIFISGNAERNLSRLQEALDMIGREHWTDKFATTTTGHCIDFQLIFETELKFCEDLLKNNKTDLAVDAIIAILLALRHNATGFYNCNNDAQQILNQLGALWKQLMGSDLLNQLNRERSTLPSGYVRESETEMKIQIPDQITLIIKEKMGQVLDIQTKRALYDVIEEISAEMKEVPFEDGIPFGDIPEDIVGVKHHTVVMLENPKTEDYLKSDSRPQSKWTSNELNGKSMEELREICRNEEQCAIDIEETQRKDMINYLMFPKQYVLNMKRKYHYEVNCKKRDSVLCFAHESQKEVDMHVCSLNQFDERKYMVRDGIIVRRQAYPMEVRGVEVPSALMKCDDFQFQMEKQKKTKRKEKKRQREIRKEGMRAAKRRKTCTKTCALDQES